MVFESSIRLNLRLIHCVLSAYLLCQADDTDLRERFFAEVPHRIAEYRARYFECNGSREYTSTLLYQPDDRNESWHGRMTVRGNRDCKLVETSVPDGRGFILGANAEYLFALHRLNPEDDWMLEKLEIREARGTPIIDTAAINQHADGDSELHDQLRSACGKPPLAMVADIYFPTLLQSEAFQLISIQTVPESSFVHAHVRFKLRDASQLEGEIIMSPTQFWVVRSYNLRVLDDTTGEAIGEYVFDATFKDEGEFLLPASTRIRRRSFDGLNETTDATVYDMFERYNLRNSECRLSAYGLPEPPGIGKGINRSIVFGIVGLVLLALVVAWAYRGSAK